MSADPTPPAPGPSSEGATFGLLDLGARLGAEIWWCDQIFAVAGSWVPSTDEARVRNHLAELSRVVGEHAATLRRFLPRPAPVDPEGWVRPPSAVAQDLVESLSGRADSTARLVALDRVMVPRLVVAWSGGPASLSWAAARRALGHARSDLVELWIEGEALVTALLAERPERVAEAAATAGRIEADLVAAGGLHPLRPYELPVSSGD